MDVANLGAAALVAAAAVADWRQREVPEWTVIGLVLLWLLTVALMPDVLGFHPWSGMLCGAVGLAVGIVCFGLGWLGAGDGKLLAALGLWLGPVDMPIALLATAALALVGIAVALLRPRGDLRRRGIPFACAIAPPATALLAARVVSFPWVPS